jgi:hypothetical protein
MAKTAATASAATIQSPSPPLKVRGVRGVMNEKNDHDRGFMKGINISAFMDVYQEWHAFVEGLFEVLCPWPARYPPNDELLNDLKGDHHYYMLGRGVGILVWVAICCGIAAIFR